MLGSQLALLAAMPGSAPVPTWGELGGTKRLESHLHLSSENVGGKPHVGGQWQRGSTSGKISGERIPSARLGWEVPYGHPAQEQHDSTLGTGE